VPSTQQQHDNEGRGVLFRNKNQREGRRDPDYTGTINHNGVEYWLSGWLKKSGPGSKNPGENFLSIQIGNPKDEQPSKSRQAQTNAYADDEDIPF
jgi:hypothetical protein